MKLKTTFLALLLSSIAGAQILDIVPFASGFSSPVEITHAGDTRLFVVQQSGAIRILNANGTINPANFLTLTTATIATGGERGLLGLAFHPNYATNGFFFVNYTRAGDGATVIARYSVSTTDPNVADPTSAVVLMTIAQPFANHNGGTIKFGPDGYLYIGMGDGGSGGDPGNRAQNINENLGKMLRIDVDNGSPYGIPADNPYVGVAGNDEIWAIGLRNPWKFSFNETNGDLWIADVGQNLVEEINVVSADTPGLNYGWRCYEGNSVFIDCGTTGATYTFPLATYPHSGGACSITGGYSYTGTLYPNLNNKYLFADFCINRLGILDETSGEITYSQTFSGSNNFTTFGKDIAGEMYVAGTSGTVYKIIDNQFSTNEFNRNSVMLSPNPATTSVAIKSSNVDFPAKVQLFDLTGKLLLESNLEVETDAVNTSELRTGVYMMSIRDNSGKSFTSKLVIK